jgi:hypothetical protein
MEARTSPALVTATGHDYDHWFAALEAWGAGDRGSAEARAWLRDDHGFSAWWAQKVVVEYEQARGTRVTVSIEAMGSARATVSIEQERLPIDTDRELARAAWAARLEELRRPLADGA